MKASERRREAAADTRHTQEVEIRFQQRHSMEVAPECEQRQPRESPRRRVKPSGVLFQQREEERETRKFRNYNDGTASECLLDFS